MQTTDIPTPKNTVGQAPESEPEKNGIRSFSPARFNLAAVAVRKDGGVVCLVGSSYWELERDWKKLMPRTPFKKELVQAVRMLPPEAA